MRRGQNGQIDQGTAHSEHTYTPPPRPCFDLFFYLSGRFQDKEYKLRLVQAEKGCTIIMAPALATFTLDASLYAHLGAG